MRVTIHDVATHAGVSAMTVSRVINGSPRVSLDTRRRVQASIAKLGYVPNRLARGLIQRKTGSLGLIVPDVDRSRPQLRLLTRNNVPLVLIDRSITGFDGDLVQGDSVAGARQLVEHLIGLGHRRIGMITETTDVSTARDRLQGYREALEGAGVEFDPELVAESSAIR